MSSALALLKLPGSSGQDQEDIPVLLLGQGVDGAETEHSDEADSRSSGGLRTQEEPCWEQQAGPQGWEAGGGPGTEWTALEARALSLCCPLQAGVWLGLAGSAHKTAVNFNNSPPEKPRGVSK